MPQSLNCLLLLTRLHVLYRITKVHLFCSCYLNLFQVIFTTKLKREKLQDILLIVIQFLQYIMINKARRPIHITVFILTELTLLISSFSFIINLYLDQNFSEGAYLYLVVCLLICVRTKQLPEYPINRRYSNFCWQKAAFCICSCDNFKTKAKPDYQMLGQIFSTNIWWILDSKRRDWSVIAVTSFKSKLAIFLSAFYILSLALKFLPGILKVVPREILMFPHLILNNVINI